MVIAEITQRAKPARMPLKTVARRVPSMTYEVKDHIFEKKLEDYSLVVLVQPAGSKGRVYGVVFEVSTLVVGWQSDLK